MRADSLNAKCVAFVEVLEDTEESCVGYGKVYADFI